MITNPVTPPVSHSSIDSGDKDKQQTANRDWHPHGHGQGQKLSLSLLSPNSYSLNRVYPLQSTRAGALPRKSVYGLPRLRTARGWEHPQAHLRPCCKATHLPPLGLVALPHWPRNRCCPSLHHSNISIIWEYIFGKHKTVWLGLWRSANCLSFIGWKHFRFRIYQSTQHR